MAEQQLGISLPTSVREWYSAVDGQVFDFDGWWDADRFAPETRHPLAEPARHWLNENQTAKLQSLGWPGAVTLRYSSPLGRIVIWESEGQADWILSCPSAGALQQLKEQVSAVW